MIDKSTPFFFIDIFLCHMPVFHISSILLEEWTHGHLNTLNEAGICGQVNKRVRRTKDSGRERVGRIDGQRNKGTGKGYARRYARIHNETLEATDRREQRFSAVWLESRYT